MEYDKRCLSLFVKSGVAVSRYIDRKSEKYPWSLSCGRLETEDEICEKQLVFNIEHSLLITKLHSSEVQIGSVQRPRGSRAFRLLSETVGILLYCSQTPNFGYLCVLIGSIFYGYLLSHSRKTHSLVKLNLTLIQGNKNDISHPYLGF